MTNDRALDRGLLRTTAVSVAVAVLLGLGLARVLPPRRIHTRSQAQAEPPVALTVRALDASPALVRGKPVAASPRDRTWVVSVIASPTAHGAIVVTDARGQALAPPFLLERAPPTAPTLRAIVPFRKLTPRPGEARAVSLVGAASCVEAWLKEVEGAGDVEGGARKQGAECGAQVGTVMLGPPGEEPFDPARIDDAERLLAAGEPAQALTQIDRVRGGAIGPEASRADAVGAEAAILLGRNVLGRALAERGLREPGAIGPSLRARLLRSAIQAQGEATGATPEVIPDRDVLRSTEAVRPEPAEKILDAALDLRLALDHDRVPGPRFVPVAAARLLDASRDADDRTLGAAAMMICRAARAAAGERAPSGETILARGARVAEQYGTLEDRAYCALTAGDEAREARRFDDARAYYDGAIALLGDHPLPREQRQTWFSAARLAAAQGRYPEAFRFAREAYRWVDFSLALQTDLAERDGLLADTFGYYGWAERFAILAHDPGAAVAAAEWGKARTFGALLRDDGEVAGGASGAFVVAHDDEGETRARLASFAGSLRGDDAALSFTALGADDAGRLEIAIGVVTRDRTAAYLVPRPDNLCPDVRAFSAAVAQGDDDRARTLGLRLYNGLLAPISAELVGIHRLFVSPHLCLQALPWPALYDGERFVAERFSVARVPPLVALDRTPRDDAPVFGGAAARAWMIAYDPAHEHEPALPGLDALAGEVAARVQPTIRLSGAALTPGSFLDGAGRVDALFYAGHARYDAANPLRSALLVAPSPSGVDRIEARAVLGLGHRLDLVFLLGCETSRLLGTPLDYSDEAMGLQRAFLAGGARHVLGALWPVLDRDAEDFVRALLENGDSGDVVSVVGAAQRCVIEKRCAGRGLSTWGSFLVDAR